MIPRVRVLALLLAATTLAACGNDTDSAGQRSDVLRNLSTEVITPVYEGLDRSTAELAAATAALCRAPDEANRRTARTAWTRAWTDWNRTRAFRFGPLVEFDAGADIAFMLDSDKVDKLLLSKNGKAAPVLTDAALFDMGADVRGLEAVEYLLFTRDPLDPKVCAYAAAAAKLVAKSADGVKVGWTEAGEDAAAFRDQLADPGEGGRYLNAQAAVGDLVNGMSMALTEATRELAKAEAAPPGERESVGSHGGSRLRDMLWSVRASYLGSSDGTTGAGVGELVAAMSKTADARVRDLLEEADREVARFPASLDDASADALDNAYRAVRSTGTIVRAEVASELGVTLSLGDADGDS